MTDMEIDWTRMAEPQADGYDTDVTIHFAAEAGYRRPPVEEPCFLDGAVSLRPDPDLQFPDDCKPAAPSHPNVARAESLLRLWPAGYKQCRRLLDTVTLFRHVPDLGDHVIGSVCGPGTRGFGSIAVTVDHHVGFAEGIVHEMAHHKLRTLGVDFENATRLILNPPTVTYPSPIRYDCLRPMSAVLHAQYSYTYILQLDLHILAARQDPARDRDVIAYSLAVIAPKLEFGLKVIRAHALVSSDGSDFLSGLYAWSDRIIATCDRWFRESGISPEAFVHPISQQVG